MHGFEDLGCYPGSKQRRLPVQSNSRRQQALSVLDEFKSRTYTVRGVQIQFYTIGQLGKALERKPGTMRKWESSQVIPKPTFLAPNPSGDVRAKRRLYSRAQCEGILLIAQQEGIIGDDSRPVGSTGFTKRVIELFQELSGK